MTTSLTYTTLICSKTNEAQVSLERFAHNNGLTAKRPSYASKNSETENNNKGSKCNLLEISGSQEVHDSFLQLIGNNSSYVIFYDRNHPKAKKNKYKSHLKWCKPEKKT